MNLNQVTLPSHDINISKQFYIKLGFNIIVDTPHYLRFECPGNGATFSLALSTEQYDNGAVIYFEYNQLEQWVAELMDMGINFDEPIKKQPYLWQEASLTDPSGNKIKLYWAGDNRRNPPWRVS